jgi:hypothetical protein
MWLITCCGVSEVVSTQPAYTTPAKNDSSVLPQFEGNDSNVYTVAQGPTNAPSNIATILALLRRTMPGLQSIFEGGGMLLRESAR